MSRLWRLVSGRRRRVDLSRLQGVRPAAARGRRRNSDAPYSAWDLRLVLALVPMRISSRRRLAAILPVAAAAAFWFTIPAWAAGVVQASATGHSHRLADVLSSVACPPPAPVVSLTGPASIEVGQTATYTVTAQRQDAASSAPSVVSVTLPTGFSFGPAPAGATVSGSTLSVTYTNGSPTQPASMAVAVVAPPSPAPANDLTATSVVTTTGDARCPSTQATSRSTLHVDVVAVGTLAASSAGPLGVTASQAGLAPGGLGSPVTGVNTGILRTTAIGVCLLISGFIVMGGIRRNPHADALARRGLHGRV